MNYENEGLHRNLGGLSPAGEQESCTPQDGATWLPGATQGGNSSENGRGGRDSFSSCVRPDHRAGRRKGQRGSLLGDCLLQSPVWTQRLWPLTIPTDPRAASLHSLTSTSRTGQRMRFGRKPAHPPTEFAARRFGSNLRLGFLEAPRVVRAPSCVQVFIAALADVKTKETGTNST